MDSKKYNLTLDSEEEVRHLLTALPRVDAPSNFDFEVKARIASRKHQGSWVERIPFALKFAFPTLLIMLVGAYVYLYQFAGQTTQQGDAVVSVSSTAAEPTKEISTPSTPAETPGASVAQNDPASEALASRGATPDRVNNPATKQTSKTPQGGSKLLAGGNGQVLTKPGAVDPRNAPGVGPDVSQRSVKDVLSPIGIETVYANGGYKVIVVTENSPAMRSGIIKGDIVTAIGNQQLKQNSSFRGTAATNKITVVRDGKPVSIKVEQN